MSVLRSRRPIAGLAGLCVSALTVSLFAVVSPAQAAPQVHPRPTPKTQRKVPVRHVPHAAAPRLSRQQVAAAAVTRKVSRTVRWPEAATVSTAPEDAASAAASPSPEPSQSPTADATAVPSPTKSALPDPTLPHSALPDPGASASAAPAPADADYPIELVGGDAEEPIALEVLSHRDTTRLGIQGLALKPVEMAKPDGADSPKESDRTKTAPSLTVDYSGFATAYGGDYAGRLTVFSYPACYLTTPKKVACGQGVALPTKRDLKAKTLSARITVGKAAPTAGMPRTLTTSTEPRALVVQAAAASSSGTGDFSATPLAESSSWEAGGSSGAFTWSDPWELPGSLGGLDPDLTLTYNSQTADGRTASTNNQTTSVGEGFDLGSSYIERGYATCKDDGQAGKYDLCWKTDNASLVLNGSSNELVKVDSSGATWRLKNDDGTRVRRYAGANSDNDDETWQVTTPDGTQYTFGREAIPGATGSTASVWTVPVFGDDAGEPCHASTFAASSCLQAWRWNLDYVTDLDDNAMSYWYGAETNKYAKNGVGSSPATYTAGGRLSRIDYGMKTGAATANRQVKFTYLQRCPAATISDPSPSSCSANTAANWPDVPTDQVCTGTSCTGKVAPTFFAKYRVGRVVASIRRGGALVGTDRWDVTSAFLSTGTAGNPSLFPSKVQHTSVGGDGASITDTPTVFAAEPIDNRVDTISDGISALPRWRLSRLTTETGAETTVIYSDANSPDICTPTSKPADNASNDKLCFAQKWTPPGAGSPRTDWFHKLVVRQVTTEDPTGDQPHLMTRYSYSGGGAWVLNDDPLVPESYRTFSQWRGYGKVTTLTGDPAAGDKVGEQVDTYLRGLDGKTVTDSQGGSHADAPQYAGMSVESTTNTEQGGPAFTSTIGTAWSKLKAGSASNAEHAAYFTAVASSTTRERKADNAWRSTTTRTTYDDDTGLPTAVSDSGDDAVSGDETCATTSYVSNRTATGIYILGLPSQTVSSKGACTSGSATLDKDTFLAGTRTSYDGAAVGAAPTRGLTTKSERVRGFDASDPQWQTTEATTYDSYSRPLVASAMSANGNLVPTTTTYTDTEGTITKTVDSVSANGRTYDTTTDFDPTLGLATKVTAPTGLSTTRAYDALGRLTAVWLPNRVPGSTTSSGNANYTFTYSVSNTAPSWVKTSITTPDGLGYTDSVSLYDSLLRPLQSQSPAPSGSGRVLETTIYNTRGDTRQVQADTYADGAPAGDFVSVSPGNAASTTTTLDGMGRPTMSTVQAGGHTFKTSTSYGGAETTTVTPPDGAPATRTVTDIDDQVTTRTQLGTPDLVTRFSYNLRGDVTKVEGPSGSWNYQYDALGRKVSVDDPDAGTTTTTYTAGDSMATTTDGRNKTLTHTYDDLGRTLGLYQGATASASALLTSWTWDTVQVGSLSSTSRYAPDGTVFEQGVEEYNKNGQPNRTSLKITNPAGGGIGTGFAASYTTKYSYNAGASLNSQTLPALAPDMPASASSFSYNNLGLVTSQSDIFESVSYDALSQPFAMSVGRSLSHPLYLMQSFEDGTRRLQSRVGIDGVSNAKFSAHTYTYDDAGQPVKDVDTSNGTTETQCFKYDDHARLSNAWTPASGDCAAAPSASSLGGPAPYAQAWTYNDRGQRATQTSTVAGSTKTTQYSYPAATEAHPNSLTSTTTGGTSAAYAYDAAGNTTSRSDPSGGMQNVAWSDEEKVSSITRGSDPATKTSFFYGADGEVLVKSSPTERVLYFDSNEVHIAKASGKVTGVRTFSSPMGDIATQTGSQFSFQVPNNQGTAQVSVADGTFAVTKRWFTPFGEDRSPPGPVMAWPTDQGFLNAPTDTSLGLTDVGARQYDAATGRFISVDPVLDTEDPTSLLGYTYGGNNPIAHADPSGLNFLDSSPGGTAKAQKKAEKNWSNFENSSRGRTYEAHRQVLQAKAHVAVVKFQAHEGQKKVLQAVKGIAKIAMDELGVTAGLECVSGGNAGACVETALNVLSAVAGSLVGKIAGKYLFHAKKAASLVKRLYSFIKKGLNALSDLIKSRKALKRSEKILAKTQKIETHLARSEIEYSAKNDAMLARIKSAGTEGTPLSKADHAFMRHELTENWLMNRGVGIDRAHKVAGWTHPTYGNFDPSVIKQLPQEFNSNWRRYWKIE